MVSVGRVGGSSDWQLWGQFYAEWRMERREKGIRRIRGARI